MWRTGKPQKTATSHIPWEAREDDLLLGLEEAVGEVMEKDILPDKEPRVPAPGSSCVILGNTAFPCVPGSSSVK